MGGSKPATKAATRAGSKPVTKPATKPAVKAGSKHVPKTSNRRDADVLKVLAREGVSFAKAVKKSPFTKKK